MKKKLLSRWVNLASSEDKIKSLKKDYESFNPTDLQYISEATLLSQIDSVVKVIRHLNSSLDKSRVGLKEQNLLKLGEFEFLKEIDEIDIVSFHKLFSIEYDENYKVKDTIEKLNKDISIRTDLETEQLYNESLNELIKLIEQTSLLEEGLSKEDVLKNYNKPIDNKKIIDILNNISIQWE